MEWYGIEEELTFLHATLQEFLAAVHLTTLENEEQVRLVKEIVKSKSWYQKTVLQFYVGLIGLDNSEVFTAILQRCVINISQLGLSSYYGEEGFVSFMTFVNCIFEAQSGHLCQKLVQFDPSFAPKEFDMCLTFSFTRFNTAADLSHLGYFIGWFCQQQTCRLSFENCYITPQQFRMFVDQIKEVCTNGYHSPS